MSDVTPEKTHALLEKLAHHVMTEVPEVKEKIVKTDEKIDKLAEYMMKELPSRQDVDEKIVKTDEKIDKLAEYMMKELPTRQELDSKLEEKADKKDVQRLLDGQDNMARELEAIRTEQKAFNHAFVRFEKRVEKLERTH